MQKDKGLFPALILALICLIATGLLAFTSQSTQAARDEQVRIAENKIKLLLFPSATDFESVDISAYEEQWPEVSDFSMVIGDNNEQIGYLLAASTRGYGGQVPIMVGVDLAGNLNGVRVLANDETPGLGKKIEEEAFLNQLSGQTVDTRFTTANESDRTTIDIVSGATISSKAVTDSLNDALDLFSKIEKEGF